MRAVRAPLDLRSSPRPPTRFLVGFCVAVFATAATSAETSSDQDIALGDSLSVFEHYCVSAIVDDSELRPDLRPVEHDPAPGLVVKEWWVSPFSVLKELRTASGLRGCQINPVPTGSSGERPSSDVLAEVQYRFDEWADSQKTQKVFVSVSLCSESRAAYQRGLETRAPNADGNYVKVFLAVFDDPRNFFIVAAESGPTPHSCDEGS